MTQLHTSESNNSSTLRISVILRYDLFWGMETAALSLLSKRSSMISHNQTAPSTSTLSRYNGRKQTFSFCPADLTRNRAAICHHRNRREQPDWRFYFNDSTRSWKFQTRSFLTCFTFKPNEVFKQRLMGETIKRKNKNGMLTN